MRKLTILFITIVAIVVIAIAAIVVRNEIKYAEPQSMFYMGKHYCPKCKTGMFVDMRTVSKCPTCGYRFWLYSDEVDSIK